MTITDMMYVKKIIEKECAENGYDGVVITHGTDTMEETAFLLDLTLQADIPVVLTGAMRSSNDIGADGLHNLISAVRTAEEEQAKEKGVLVVFNDEIHAAAEVTKAHTTNVSAFQSMMSGPVGSVTADKIIFHYHPVRQEKIPVNEINQKVALLKACAGMDSDILYALKDMNYDGVVIEAFGQGNLPPGMIQGIETLIKAAGIPVVIVSRCPRGPVSPVYDYKGGGRHLRDLGVIFCQNLSGPKARIKFMAALAFAKNRKELIGIMENENSRSII
jgi:L-asparaginase